ncbi:hypothetical protein KFK09_015684 [Dendrobium nobile]|uniref:Uncharacterized protein n=1 Tax=Dendrobium nobile TaxID=94219 RepID=A0A8T3B6Q0_DENNO|nr:hypothetical protein KFK09_015684 [Dendrobium nobile]
MDVQGRSRSCQKKTRQSSFDHYGRTEARARREQGVGGCRRTRRQVRNRLELATLLGLRRWRWDRTGREIGWLELGETGAIRTTRRRGEKGVPSPGAYTREGIGRESQLRFPLESSGTESGPGREGSSQGSGA